MATNKTILLVGGAETGKTNFLVRLWLGLRNGQGKMHLTMLPDSLEVFEADTERLLGGEFAERTLGETGNEFSISFNIPSDEIEGDLLIPDLSGETWERVWNERVWPSSLMRNISACDGLVLFIRNNTLVDPLNWIELAELIVRSNEVNFNGLKHYSSKGEAKRVPTQTLLVEWLQLIQEIGSSGSVRKSALRVAIVIAAWDELDESTRDLGPEHYVETRIPLLYQYMQTHMDVISFKVFALSVAGGDLANDPKFRQEFLDGDPTRGGFVLHSLDGDLSESNDFSLPIVWTLGLPIS